MSLRRFTCSVCKVVELARGGSKAFRCSGCVDSGAQQSGRIYLLTAQAIGQMYAMGAVSRAISAGRLAHPSRLVCVDCGLQAQQYDHRDYNQPLFVEPICRKCNRRRGPAVPMVGGVERMLSHGLVPYVRGASLRALAQMLGVPEAAHGVGMRATLDDWKRAWALMGPRVADVACGSRRIAAFGREAS